MAFVYAMLLHALVFIVLWRFSLGATDISTFSQECQVKLVDFFSRENSQEFSGRKILVFLLAGFSVVLSFMWLFIFVF